jgi:hypothetical protein
LAVECQIAELCWANAQRAREHAGTLPSVRIKATGGRSARAKPRGNFSARSTWRPREPPCTHHSQECWQLLRSRPIAVFANTRTCSTDHLVAIEGRRGVRSDEDRVSVRKESQRNLFHRRPALGRTSYLLVTPL